MHLWMRRCFSIIVNTEQLYAVPKAMQQAMQGKRARVTKKAISKTDSTPDNKGVGGSSSAETVTTKEHTHDAAVTTNTFYEPNVLPDYGGELYQHVNAKLHWYSSLRRGTLVMVRATLHAFNWKERRVYQLNAHTVRVMDPSKLDMEPLSSQASGSEYDTGASSSKLRASDAMAGVQLGKRAREE
ncbi:uncharacterized protein HD556DRAFT_1443734 [Suillus plorans]|uniref:Uncharacterized protein n=1 Tax=Suillus plorans TaxID=116603 RepID=A0A9P7ANU5_9AGAM|nr:uncharacterized protein HD556DRAFT_1443734 [Suillus plorans]KAG1793307.1 hypothetical protein HD556DRAFT_1443734 [Suillus plorans]